MVGKGAGAARSRIKSLKYYRRRKLCDVLIHGDHLSIYMSGLSPEDDDTGLAVGGTGKYVHTQVRTVDEVRRLLPLLASIFGAGI